MKLLVTGAAGFIGSTYVRLVAGEHEVMVLDKLTYAGRRENLEGVGAHASSRARSRTRRWCARRWRAPTRWSTSPPSRTWTARSRARTRSP